MAHDRTIEATIREHQQGCEISISGDINCRGVLFVANYRNEQHRIRRA